MSGGLGKCSRIRHVVRLRQMLRRWRNKTRTSAHRIPSDVPAGHVVVCVGINYRRFVVRASHLNHPIFQKLLVKTEEEYGFSNHGPLTIPCDEVLFEEVIRFISGSECGNSTRFEDFHRYCHVDIRSNSISSISSNNSNNLDLCPESRPLLTHKTIW